MEYSNYLNLNLPSINNTVDLAIIDDISENFVKLDKKADEVDGDIEQNASDIEGLRIINTASGSSIALKDSAIAKLRNLKVFGKTTQNGTPTPDNPIALKSIGDSGSYEVGVYGRNLFDIGTVSDYFNTSNDGKTLQLTLIVSATTTFNITDNTINIESYNNSGYRWISKWIKLTPNTDYTISIENIGGLISVVGLNSNKNGTTGEAVINKNQVSNTAKAVKFNSGNYKYYIISFYPSNAGVTFKNIQVELGTQATPYEPFNQQLITLTDTLRGIGDIRDEIDFERGVYIQRYEKIKLNSTYGWIIHSSSAVGSNGLRCFQVTITTDKLCANTNENVETNSLCTHLPITSSQKVFENTSDNESSIAMFSADTRIVIRARNSSCRSLDDWISFLENNEVYLIYELATPIETPITEQELNDYKKLYTKKPNTTIISEADMEVDYVADPKLYIDNKIAELTALTLEV